MKLGLNGRFMYEMIIGALTLAAVFYLGSKGAVVLGALALTPFICKRELDEREMSIFYRTGNSTLALAIVTFVACHMAGFVPPADMAITMAASAVMVIHGLCGIILLRTQ